MCYFCHTLKNNTAAPKHRSIKCLDSRNTFHKQKCPDGSKCTIDESEHLKKYYHICSRAGCISVCMLHANSGHEKLWYRCLVCNS